MYKSIKVELPKLLELLNHHVPLGVSRETVELLAILMVYSNYKFIQVQCNQQYQSSHMIKDIITTEMNTLTDNSEAMKQYFAPFNAYLATCSDEINQIVERRFFDVEKTYSTDVLNICLTVIKTKKGRNTEILVTPRSVLRILSALAEPKPSKRLLDLNSRKGELSDVLNSEYQIHDTNLTSYCFKPFDYLINTLQAKLRGHEQQKVNIDTPYHLSNIPNDYFDLVITNPPFGNMPKNIAYNGKETLPTYFLRKALLASKTDAKILFIMPETFTHSTNKQELMLRKELIEEQSIKAIIQLPDTAFSPYTNVFTAVVFIDKSQKYTSIKLIKVDKKVSDFATDELGKIVSFINKDIEFKQFPNVTVHTEEIIYKNYDLRAETYLPAIQPLTHRKLSEIRKEIEHTEEELRSVRTEIDKMIDLMEQER